MKEPILVRGKDGRGVPFVLTAQTSDIAASGAAVTSMSSLGEPGAKVEIDYQGRKAWFRIQWVDRRGVSTRGRAGLKSLEPGNYIWGVQLEAWSPDSFQKSEDAPGSEYASSIAGIAAAVPEPGTERRRFPRFSCRIEAMVAEEGGSIRLAGKVSDISLGGCYVEMLSPMPVHAFVELLLNPDTVNLRLHGKVLTSEIGMGMGIAFTTISPEDFERLREMVSPSPPQPWDPEIPAKVAESSAAIRALREGGAKRISQGTLATEETLAAVLRILLRKGVVSEDELAAEFEKLMELKS